MFANGGDVLKGYITFDDGSTITVDPNQFKQQISGLTDSQVFAFAKDVRDGNRVISEDLKSILDQEANFRDVPAFPGQYSFGAFFEDTPRVATKIVGPIARFGVEAAKQFTSPKTRQGLPALLENVPFPKGDLKNITEYDSDLFPFNEESVESLFLRGGRSPQELDYGIRSLFDVEEETVVPDEKQIPETIVTAKRIDPIETLNLDERPEMPKTIADFSDDIAKDLEDLESDVATVNKDFIPKVEGPDSSIVSITQEDADEINKEEDLADVDDDDEDDDEDSVNTLVNKPGFFGSDRFLNFIRNVGGELVRTGQFGEGLASGAAKAAEERAARELLADQEKRKYEREIELAKAKAEATGAKPMATDKIIELNEKMITDINEFKGGVAATGFVDLAIETIEEAQESGEAVGGALGWINSFADKVGAFFGVQKEFNGLSAQEKVNKLVEVVRQKNLQAILGESGRTISDRDRTIILEVFGNLSATQDASITLGKLRESRRGLADSNEKRKRTIATTLPILGQQGTYGQQFFVNLLPIYGEIQGIDPQASQAASVLQRLLGKNVQTGVTEIDLAG